MEQSRDPMDKNRIRGLPGRTSEPRLAKSAAIKGRGVNPEGCAVKAVGLASGGLRRVRNPGLSGSSKAVIAGYKPAEDIVVGLPTKDQTTDRATGRAGSCGPRCRTSSWN